MATCGGGRQGQRDETAEEAAAERRGWDERRSGGDRRQQPDRRGSGLRLPPSDIPRPYVFRDFRDRRNPQDRRLYRDDGSAWERRDQRPPPADPVVVLTEDEIRCLLGRRPRR